MTVYMKILLIIYIITLTLNSIYNKINIEEKGKGKRWLIKSISVFITIFLLWFIYNLSDSYNIEEFLENLIFILKQSFVVALLNMIIYQPAFFVLDNVKKKNIYKIILAIIFILVIDAIILIKNFSIG